MHCPNCNHENPEHAKFCLECGARLAGACPDCGTELPAQAKFCLECGAQIGAGPAPARTVAAETLAERLQRLVPKEFAERLLATQRQVGKERRTVTILFSDVKGSTSMAVLFRARVLPWRGIAWGKPHAKDNAIRAVR